MIEDAPTPPPGFLTPEEIEKLTQFKEERHDAAREERELLLAFRAYMPADYQLPKFNADFEEMVKGMSPEEREGFALLDKDGFIRWTEIQERGFAAVRAQYELHEAVDKRIRGERDKD